jgi:hypothetical protein
MKQNRPNSVHMSGKKVQNDHNKFNELQRSSATTMLSSTQPSVAPEIAKVEEKESGIGFVISRMFDIDLKNPKTLLPIAIAGAVVGFFIFGG